MDFFMNYFDILHLSKEKEIDEQKITESYNKAKGQLENATENVKNKNNEKEMENIKTWRKEISKAYEYCMSKEGLTLRNKIIEINKKANNKGLSAISEQETFKGNVGENIKVKPSTQLPSQISKGMKIKKSYDIEFENKMPDKNIEQQYTNEIGFLDKTLGKYELQIKTSDRSYIGYEFFSGDINIEELKRNPDYLKVLLQKVEKNQMVEDEIYIGEIKRTSKGIYEVAVDAGQRDAAKKANSQIEKLESMESEQEWER